MENKKIGVEEIYLAPETQKIKNAEEIANLSLGEEKQPFIIQYLPSEKETVKSELKTIGCGEIKQLDFANCLAVSMSRSQLKAIKTLQGVDAVEKDYDYRILSSTNEEELVTYLAGETRENEGKEVRLAIFDTGVSNITVDGVVNFIQEYTEDENGHGTKMTGIVSSVIADTKDMIAVPRIYSLGVASKRGLAKTSVVMEALDWAINNKIKIVSMSFGDYHKSNMLEKMINRAAQCGIVMVAAVGNDGGFKDEDRIMYPAAFDNVLSVGATNGEIVAKYSNGGTNADCFACGSQMTTDINGNAVNVVGTSGATAFVAGRILNNWCAHPEKTASEIIADIKTEMSFKTSVNAAEGLTKKLENDIVINEKIDDNSAMNVLQLTDENTMSSNSEMTVMSINNNDIEKQIADGMSSAKKVSFFNWVYDSINCPCDEVWYKFSTTGIDEAHPNGSKGWYGVLTQGSLDTIGYLYDSYGNLIASNDDDGEGMNFKISRQLEYGKTYYVRVKAYGDNTGSYSFKVDYGRDDHGNTMSTATEIVGVYYEDKSINGHLHSYGDTDYYAFVPERNCVMEIYTEGGTDTYGSLYCAEEGGLLCCDNNSNGNGNFKITAHLQAMKRYYIAVTHNSPTGYGNYTLRFKFIKDCYIIPSGYFSNTIKPALAWFNDEYTKYPTFTNPSSAKYYMYTNKDTALLWRDQYLTNIKFRDALVAALGVVPSEADVALLNYGISYISPSDIITDMIVSIIIAFLSPYIERVLFNATYNQMNGSDLMRMEQFTLRESSLSSENLLEYEYNDYRACTIYNESNDYVYGFEGQRGKWAEINL